MTATIVIIIIAVDETSRKGNHNASSSTAAAVWVLSVTVGVVKKTLLLGFRNICIYREVLHSNTHTHFSDAIKDCFGPRKMNKLFSVKTVGGKWKSAPSEAESE